MSSIYSNMQTTNTIAGIRLQILNQLPFTEDYLSTNMDSLINMDHSLNAKYNVEAGTLPTNIPKLQYFGIGIRGAYKEDIPEGTSEEDIYVSPTSPYRPSSENLDLFYPIPIRVVTQAEDLVMADRENYRMRVDVTIDENDFVFYYLKKIDTIDFNNLSIHKVNVATGAKEAYYNEDYDPLEFFNENSADDDTTTQLDTQKLKKSIEFGEITHHIEVGFEAQCIIRGNEIQEFINIIKGGNRAHGFISEIGFYSGEDKTIEYPLNSGIEYVESVGTYLNIHRCMSALDISSPGSKLTVPLILTNGSSVIAGNTTISTLPE